MLKDGWTVEIYQPSDEAAALLLCPLHLRIQSGRGVPAVDRAGRGQRQQRGRFALLRRRDQLHQRRLRGEQSYRMGD